MIKDHPTSPKHYYFWKQKKAFVIFCSETQDLSELTEIFEMGWAKVAINSAKYQVFLQVFMISCFLKILLTCQNSVRVCYFSWQVYQKDKLSDISGGHEIKAADLSLWPEKPPLKWKKMPCFSPSIVDLKTLHNVKYSFHSKLKTWPFKHIRKIGQVTKNGHLLQYMVTGQK